MRTFCPLLLLLACQTRGEPAAPRCGWEAGAHARVLGEDGPFFTGPDALATPGDLLLANPVSAFVIQSVDHPKTYYHYGGIPIDVVPMDGCTQARPERFGELGFLPSRLNLLDFEMSTMHQLRATSVSIVNDGADGGPAHVRFEAVDDRFWLVELSLLKAVVERGDRKELGGTLGASFVIDYILPPDRPVLEIRVTATNTQAEPNDVLVGAAMFPSDTLRTGFYSDGTFGFNGFSLDTRVPWFTSAGADGSYAFAWDSDGLGRTNVSGVEALLDLNQILGDPWTLAPAGEAGDSRTAVMYLAVGATDASSAITALHGSLPTMLGAPYEPAPLRGVVKGTDGAPIAGARVIVEGADQTGAWIWLSELRTAADGAFSGTFPQVAGASRRLRVVVDGRPEPAPIPLDGPVEDLAVAVEPGATLVVSVRDEAGAMPARVSVFRGADRERVGFATPDGALTLPVKPGEVEVVVSRGFGWEPVVRPVTLVAGAEARVDVTLPVGPDTSGWLSFDGHVHAGPSADSDLLMADRFATGASEGLDVMIHTDHEIITDPRPAVQASIWSGHVASMVGEEFTATVPEHLNMYGLEVGPEDGPRGAPPTWYGKDLATLYADMRARGAGVRTLNHPKNNCSYMCLIDWDTVNAVPRVTDPTLFGLQPDATLWSWDFEAVELLNGAKYIFLDPNHTRDTGLFDDWANFWHHGHRIAAVGVSDAHGADGVGTPRTWFTAPSADLLAFEDAWVVDAIKGGHVMIGAGAFARAAVAGAGPGDTVTDADGAVELALRVEGIPSIDVRYATVFANCDAVAKVDASAPDGVVKLDTSVGLTLTRDTAIVVAAFGDDAFPRGLEPMPAWTPRVLTNPILVDVDGNGVWDPPGGKTCSYAGMVPAAP